MTKKIIARVMSIKNSCYVGYQVGDEFDISKMKGRGLCVKDLSPFTKLLKNGSPLPWEKDPSKARVACSSPDGTVVFELRLVEE
jgi:uncharacterized repeat protein (TIGR04076 family)